MIIVNENIHANREWPTHEDRLLFYNLDIKWQRKYFCSCGTTVGLVRHGFDISVTKTEDKELHYDGYYWANSPFITALQYCGITSHQQHQRWNTWKSEKDDRKHRKECPLPKGSTFLEFEIPLIEMFLKTDLDALVACNKAELWKQGKDCKTHKYPLEDQLKYTYEYAITPSNKPKPFMLIIPGPNGKFTEKDRKHFTSVVLPDLENKNPDATILFLPRAHITTTKEPNKVQTNMVSMIGLKILGYLNNKYSKIYP